MEDIFVNHQIVIPSKALKFTFSRSGGKGGQNVNKVSTKVEALLDVQDVNAPEEIKKKLKHRLSYKMDGKGLLRIVSQESRSQWQNRNIVINKLIDLINDALVDEKERVPTKPSKSSKRQRVDKKKKHGLHKTIRRKKISLDD